MSSSEGLKLKKPHDGILWNKSNKLPQVKVQLLRKFKQYLLFIGPPTIFLMTLLYLYMYPVKLVINNRAAIIQFLRLLLIDCLKILTHDAPNKMVLTIVSVPIIATILMKKLLAERKEFLGDNKPKKICVIGAGISGILTAKHCIEEGHEVTVLDRENCLGGVWSHKAWNKTMLSSSNMNTSFSDFIFPEIIPSNDPIGFASRDEFFDYIEGYAKYFHVDKTLMLGCEVVIVEKNGSSYLVSWRKFGETRAEITKKTFDYVAVCTGLPGKPKESPMKNSHVFEGNISHSANYVGPNKFQNERVLVVGTGESASDIIHEVAEVSSDPVVVSMHSPTIVLHRDYFEVAPDYVDNRILLDCPAIVRYGYLKIIYFLAVFFGNLSTSLQKMPNSSAYLQFLTHKFNPTNTCAHINVTKSAKLLIPIGTGRAVSKPKAIECVGGKKIKFEDGSIQEFDEIILSHGYNGQNRYPFLEDLGLQNIQDRDRYHLMIEPSYPKIGFIGFTRGQLGSLVILMEVQARWFALLASGKRRLPSKRAMTKRVKYIKSIVRGKYMTRAPWSAANYIARHEVLCEPNLLSWFLRKPRLVWLILTRSFASWQYRLNGPGAKPDLAIEAYESVQLNSTIPGQTIHRIIMFIIGTLNYVYWWTFCLLPFPNFVKRWCNFLIQPCTYEIY